MDISHKVELVETQPYDDQKPGTSGLRKKVTQFQQPNYTENFIQSILNVLDDKLPTASLVVGGDGRFFLRDAIKIIIQIAAANKVKRIVVGKCGILSTPAVSCLIRKFNLLGGIILTASHNPGGPNEDFGIKYNCDNGGPAPSSVTDKIYACSRNIINYRIVRSISCNIDCIGSYSYMIDGNTLTVDVIDPINDYLILMRQLFDFHLIRTLLTGSDGAPRFRILIDSLNGVTGPYARRIFVTELGASPDSVVGDTPLEDFGGLHPDPNLIYAKRLVEAVRTGAYNFGAAFDGDGDRNMIVGEDAYFVNPCDSLAVIADNLDCVPYFRNVGLRGLARSMPTSSALDQVAEEKCIQCYEVPTGWKYFGNLMDAGRLSLCGEESFGIGSDHIREKDGIWAVLTWLSIIAKRKLSVRNLLESHWTKYGRHYFTRYDYENFQTSKCQLMMYELEKKIEMGFDTIQFSQQISIMDNFSYIDPIDGSTTSKQGIRVIFKDGSRFVMRLSGTGSSGSTVRLYAEMYSRTNVHMETQIALKPIIDIALEISELVRHLGVKEPTVIT